MDFPKTNFRNVLLDPIPLDTPPIMLPGNFDLNPKYEKGKEEVPIVLRENTESHLKETPIRHVPVFANSTPQTRNLKSPTNDTNSVVHVPGEGLRLRKTTESTWETVQDVFKDMKIRMRKTYGKHELFNRYPNDITGPQGEYYERVKLKAMVTISELRPKTRAHLLHILEQEKPHGAEDLLARVHVLRPDN